MAVLAEYCRLFWHCCHRWGRQHRSLWLATRTYLWTKGILEVLLGLTNTTCIKAVLRTSRYTSQGWCFLGRRRLSQVKKKKTKTRGDIKSPSFSETQTQMRNPWCGGTLLIFRNAKCLHPFCSRALSGRSWRSVNGCEIWTNICWSDVGPCSHLDSQTRRLAFIFMLYKF